MCVSACVCVKYSIKLLQRALHSNLKPPLFKVRTACAAANNLSGQGSKALKKVSLTNSRDRGGSVRQQETDS